jgi:hypothetical protein
MTELDMNISFIESSTQYFNLYVRFDATMLIFPYATASTYIGTDNQDSYSTSDICSKIQERKQTVPSTIRLPPEILPWGRMLHEYLCREQWLLCNYTF